MKTDKLQDALTEIDEELIAEAGRKEKKRSLRAVILSAAAACVLLAGGLITAKMWSPLSAKNGTEREKKRETEVAETNTDKIETETVKETKETKGASEKEGKVKAKGTALRTAVYPSTAKNVSSEEYIGKNGIFDNEAYEKDREAWEAVWKRQMEESRELPELLNGFYQKILAGTFSEYAGENTICSPANLYLALSMLAEVTDGESRTEILEVLGASDIVSLRDTASKLWDSNYVDNGELVTLLANAVFLKEDLPVSEDALKTLAEEYFADIYAGDPTDAGYAKCLQDWLNEKTGGQLRDTVKDVRMDPEMYASLVSTIYFRGKWQYPFNPADTEKMTFHGVKADEQAEFMYRYSTGAFYYFDHFSAICLEFSGGDYMWLILPDEGYTPEEIAAEPDLLWLLSKGLYSDEHRSWTQIRLHVPKFDITSDIDEAPVLKKLGMKSVFESDSADFSPLLPETDDVFLSKVQHSARVVIDEEGCTATAFTLEDFSGSGMPEEEIEFTLDRPFLYAVTSYTGANLFTGSVNDITE